jgi:hypothetical protein
VFKKLFHIDLDGAQDVGLLVGESTLAPRRSPRARRSSTSLPR